jgi:Carbohydrate phosphorylase
LESSRLAVDVTDKWLRFGHPWEIVRSEIACDVKFSGRTESYYDGEGRYRVHWAPEKFGERRRLRHAGPRLSCAQRKLIRLWKAEAAGTASEAKSQVCDLPGELHPAGKHGIEGVARI